MKAISFTPEVLKSKLRVLEEHKRCMTRRPVKVPRSGYNGANLSKAWADPTSPFGSCLKVPCDDGETVQRLYPPHQPGALLWIRERAQVLAVGGGLLHPTEPVSIDLCYSVDGVVTPGVFWPLRIKWVPRVGACIPNGVHREGARHFLEVVEVRAERVSGISADDAILEGINPSDVAGLGGDEPLRQAYFALYDSIYGSGAHSRDWCWVYTLKRAPT